MPPTERPDDDVIESDGELDAWWNKFLQEQQRKAGKRVGGGMMGPMDISDNALPFYGALPQAG